MSGPIVRKYGFPNFDKIFGPKPVPHGADDDPKAEASNEPSPTSTPTEARATDAPGSPPSKPPRSSS